MKTYYDLEQERTLGQWKNSKTDNSADKNARAHLQLRRRRNWLYEDGKDEILKALNSFKNKVEQEGTLDELSIYYDEKAGRIVKPK